MEGHRKEQWLPGGQDGERRVRGPLAKHRSVIMSGHGCTFHVSLAPPPALRPPPFWLVLGVGAGGKVASSVGLPSSCFGIPPFAFVSSVCSSAPLHDCLHVSPPCFSVVLLFPFPPSPLTVSSFSASRHLPPSLVLMVSNGFGGRPASTCRSPRAKMLL